MNDRGPFLWLSKKAPPAGFSELPRGGMCVCTFLFVVRDDRILLGKYADDPEWEDLAGLDQGRRLTNANGWTIPASHLKFGEDPRQTALRIGEQILLMQGARYSEPRTEVDAYPSQLTPGETHYDIWFFVDAVPTRTSSLDGSRPVPMALVTPPNGAVDVPSPGAHLAYRYFLTAELSSSKVIAK